jgi:hypothetical protein
VEKDNENFEPVYGREMRARGTNRKLALARRAAMPQIIDYFGA